MAGRIVQINVSAGGVPKHAIPVGQVTFGGIVGDAQRNLDVHGGPERAVCLYSKEVLDALNGEGHAIAPGQLGENVTVSGLDWRQVLPQTRWRLGTEVVLEITAYAPPCRTIAPAFRDGHFGRISPKTHPGESRVYARVLREGSIRAEDVVEPAEEAAR